MRHKIQIYSRFTQVIYILQQNIRKMCLSKNGDKKKNIIFFSSLHQTLNNSHRSNSISTGRYTILSWIPKSLFLQFSRAANIYFLIISVLTSMSFSPKSPASMITTFAIVLFFTMLKEAYEDFARHRQDAEINNRFVDVYNHMRKEWMPVRWNLLRTGSLIRVDKDTEFPADMFILKSSRDAGTAYVDTLNLDGESNLKEKLAVPKIQELTDEQVLDFDGEIHCEPPNENLEKWDANIQSPQLSEIITVNIRQLCLRGTTLRNVDFVYGIPIYLGNETKIMKNQKEQPTKVSNVMKTMNQMLFQVFMFQLLIILLFASMSMIWQANNAEGHEYLAITSNPGFDLFVVKMLTFWVAYSHMIPISLYVMLEVVKLGQSFIIRRDVTIYDKEFGFTVCRNSDLIEEMGQVEFIFTDKTGTLTLNQMVFKQCCINGKVFETREDFKAQIIKKKFADKKDEKTTSMLHEFCSHLALCHNVVVDVNKEKNTRNFMASSPDETALIEGAKWGGYQFAARNSQYVGIENAHTKGKEIYEVLHEFPFDSDRKRMSVVVRKRNDKKIILLCKGADSVLFPRLSGLSPTEMAEIDDQVYNFASKGFRVLVIAKKVVDPIFYQKWTQKYDEVRLSFAENKDHRMSELYDEFEQELTYLGSTAIEDKLQEEVPETIKHLMEANIKIWVLTGDKQETAIEIAKSCNLINLNDMDMIILTARTRTEFVIRLREAFNEFPREGRKMTLVIDGSTLNHVLSDEVLATVFIKLGVRANSVVLCRVSPKQKADVVALAKNNGQWITMAVGDGANDVPMIMEAHIGVGIKGKEGTQASRASDYTIGKFKYLKVLTQVHGRYAYRRISQFICYYFYKNVILVFCELYFVFQNGYSGQMFFPDWLPTLYNALWTSWPCMFTFMFDIDVGREMTLKNPVFFQAGHHRTYFNFRVFWVYLSKALFHGILCYYIPLIGLGVVNQDGIGQDSWWHSTVSFTLLIHVVTYKLFVDVRVWNLLSVVTTVLSLLFYYITAIILCTGSVSVAVQPQIQGQFLMMLGNAKVWLLILGAPFICLLPDITIKIFSNWYSRTPVDWQLKEIDDWNSISAVKNRDKMLKEKVLRDEALRKRKELRKLKPLEYGEEEDSIEAIMAQEREAAAQAAKAAVLASASQNGPKPLTGFEDVKNNYYDYYGEGYYDNEAYGAEYYGEESPTKGKKDGAKYKTSKTKKATSKKITIKNIEDSETKTLKKPNAKKSATVTKKKQPSQKK